MPTTIPFGFTELPTYARGEAIPGASAAGVLGADGLRAYRHTPTGLRFVLFAAPGPLVSATIVVGTQPLSNAGHPHTLEHIIFLGSHNYPARGYLDNLACRCLADGTNAWTETEYTAYTAKTVGFEGFAHLLPVFLDHILRPKINAASFASEVYHIRGDGKEAGVVFCEMQARENTEADLSDRALRAALFSGTPLALESGGLCNDIRTLSNEDIARFHYDQYCGENVTVIVGGSAIEPAALLGSVRPLLDEIASQPGYSRGQPQWQSPLNLKPLPLVSRHVVNFPCPDEDMGTVILGWRGPGIVDRETAIAIDVLLRFLDADVWSPLRQKFVETEDQLAGEIYSSMETYLEVSAISMSFSGVQHKEEDDDEDDGDKETQDYEEHHDAESLESEVDEEHSFLMSGKLELQVMSFLTDMVERRELPGGIRAIRAAIKKEMESQLTELESDSHSAIPYHLIEEVVYGHRESLIIGEESRGFLASFAALEEKDEQFWIDLLFSIFVNAPRVEVVMVPDSKLAENLAEEENAAHSERVTRLGRSALSTLGKDNEIRIASLESQRFAADVFPPIASTMNVSRWPYTVSRETSTEYGSQSVTIETDFVHCSVFIDTASMTTAQRTFLPILCVLLPSCDILLEDGSYIPYTDHARTVSELTVSTDRSGIHLGYNGDMAHQCVVLHFASMPSSFADAALVLFQTFFQSEVTTERLSAVSQTLHANSITEMRDGETVLGTAVPMIPFLEADSRWKGQIPNYTLASFLGSNPLISFLSDEFSKKKPRKQVQRRVVRKFHEALNTLRALPGSDVFIQVAARDPKPAHDIISSLWSKNRKPFRANGKVANLAKRFKSDGELPLSRRLSGRLSELLNGRSVGKIIGIAGVESCSFNVRVDSPVYIGQADWSALTVCTEMLCRMEGPLCNAVRGAGLAYGVHLENSSWLGQLTAVVYESATPATAWDAVCVCLEDFRKGLDKASRDTRLVVDLETAKASTLYSLNSGRSTPESIADGAISRTALGAPASPLADRALEEAVESVTLGSIAAVFDRHVARLCEARSRLIVVTCGQGVVQETVDAFKKCSRAIDLEECAIESLHPAEVEEVVKSLRTQ